MDSKGNYNDLLGQMMRFCAYQDRFEKEVLEKLKALKVDDVETQKKVLTFLKEEKFLDEDRTARSYVRGKILLKKWSKHKVAYQLKALGLKESAIQEALNEIDPEEYRAIALRKLKEKVQKNQKLEGFQRKAKSIQSLANEGFDIDLLKELWDEL